MNGRTDLVTAAYGEYLIEFSKMKTATRFVQLICNKFALFPYMHRKKVVGRSLVWLHSTFFVFQKRTAIASTASAALLRAGVITYLAKKPLPIQKWLRKQIELLNIHSK